MLLDKLEKKGLIHPPSFLISNTCYITVTGSVAYACADTNDTKNPSDLDCYGFCIPPRDYLFPHLRGEIPGFSTPGPTFDQWIRHGIYDPDARGGKGEEYDFTVFNIVKLFKLLMENNPNCIDTIFTRQEHVLHMTEVGNMVRENRRLFLHKGCFPKFKGYSYSQLSKMRTKDPEAGSNRAKIREVYGFDTKFATHVVRLLLEVEQILLEGDLDLQRHKEQLKAIRRGDVSEEEIRQWASSKERQLEQIYAESKLPAKPDERAITQLLLNCLESHYGSLQSVIVSVEQDRAALLEIRNILEKHGM